MAEREELSKADLEQHLTEQLGFLKASADAFDAGFEGEAKRLAVPLRVLLHDSKNSKSLLGLLGRKDAFFFNTSPPPNRMNRVSHSGLIAMAIGGSGTRYIAPLDDVPPPLIRKTIFDKWWTEAVFVDINRNSLSRRDLVLTSANQDGGAHVDPKLDKVYAELKRNSLGWVAHESGTARPMEGPERAAIRQVAHEVLKTLVPDYAKVVEHSAGMIVRDTTFLTGEAARQRHDELIRGQGSPEASSAPTLDHQGGGK